MRDQESARVLSIRLEPGAGGAEAKAIAPAVHVEKSTLATESLDVVGEQQLQVADRILLDVFAAGFGVEHLAAFAIHADDVAGLVQQRMYRRIGACVDPSAEHAGLGWLPIAAWDRLAVVNDAELEVEANEQISQWLEADFTAKENQSFRVDVCAGDWLSLGC